MKKKILTILIVSILLTGCANNKNDLEINGDHQKKQRTDYEFIDLSSIEPSIVFKGRTQDENKVLYSYVYGMKYNEEAPENLIEISISNRPYDVYIPTDREKKITVKEYEVKSWPTGSIEHTIGNINNKHIYIKSDIGKPLNYEKHLEIVEAVINYIEKNR